MRCLERNVDLLPQSKAVDGQFGYRHSQTLGKSAAVQLQLRGVFLYIKGSIAAAVGLVVQNFGVVVIDQHQVGNALHQHLSLALPCFGGDLRSGQGGDERFLPQYGPGVADAPPDSTFKKRAHAVQVQFVGQACIQQAGIDPYFFGLLFILNLGIGVITPPVGTVLYVVCGIGNIKIGNLVRNMAPFLIVEMLVLFLLLFFPSLSIEPMKFLMK